MSVRKAQTFEQLFPIPKGRKVIDETIDKLPTTMTLDQAVEACEQAYFDTTGLSPVRAQKPR